MISLRPVGGHAGLGRAARALGADFLSLSGLRIVPHADDATATALADALRAQHIVVTSPSAVRAAAALQPLRRRRGQAWHAVGAGTAAALRRAGIDRVEAPRRMDSEGLLALPGLQDIAGTSLTLLTAPGGRGELLPALVARGARVRRMDVYRREPARPAAAAVRRLLDSGDAPLWLALSSGEALQSVLAQLTDPARQRLLQARVAAASERLAGIARSIGFGQVVVAAGPRPAQLLRAMAEADIPSTRVATPSRNRR